MKKNLIIIILIVVLILSVPLIAMQFSTEVHWTLSDFIVAAVLLLSTGLAIEWTLRKVKNKNRRIAICLVLLAALMLIWAELAVGIFN